MRNSKKIPVNISKILFTRADNIICNGKPCIKLEKNTKLTSGLKLLDPTVFFPGFGKSIEYLRVF